MKKYQQLLLAILAVVSFLCLLIYRHEYNKLRYVLEVLSFFGTPSGSTTAPLFCNQNATFRKLSTALQDPVPAWQRISNSLYIYSAYWEKTEEKEHVIALSVGVLNENLNYGCYLYYDSSPKTVTGQFSFSGIPFKNSDAPYVKSARKGRTKGFVFYCEPPMKGIVPVGVVFLKSSVNESSQGFLPVIALQPNSVKPNSTGICVMPAQFSNFKKSTYLEFLAYHQILGVSNFIVYGANNQFYFLSSIHQDSTNKISLSILPWNYPFFGDYELMKLIAENDCKIRTIGVFENILILEWNKFFVPRYAFKISKILNEVDLQKKTFKFQFSTLLFCDEYEDYNKSDLTSPYVFKKTKYAFPKTDILVPIYRPNMRAGRVQKISKDIAAVQQYASCRDFKIKSGEKKVAKVDTSIFKFQNEFLNSKLHNFLGHSNAKYEYNKL